MELAKVVLVVLGLFCADFNERSLFCADFNEKG